VKCLNIVFLRSNPVDPDSRVEKEVNALLNAGHSIRILAWNRDHNHTIRKSVLNFENGKADIYRCGIRATYGGGMRKNLLPLLKFQFCIYKWLKKNIESIDAIHACDFDTAFVSSKIASKYQKKFIYDIFDYYIDAFRVPLKIKEIVKNRDHAVINKADAVIICTEKRKEQIEGTNPKKLVVIHNTPPSHNYQTSEKYNLKKDKVKIAYIGILDEGRLIRETIEIVKNNPDYEYHVAGFGRLAPLLKEISQKTDNIYFYGKIPYNQTLNLESSCDIMTALYDPSNPNNKYAAPNKFYEALMLGKPIVMVKNTGMDRIIEKNNIGIVINYSKEDLSAGIISLVENKKDWVEQSIKMRRIYNAYYNWVEMERRLIDLYSDI